MVKEEAQVLINIKEDNNGTEDTKVALENVGF